MTARIRFALATAICTVAVASLATAPARALTPYDVPTITCESATLSSITLNVCGGASGAPAGVTIQWKTAAEFAISGWSDVGLCKLSLSGQPSLQHLDKSRWELLPGECETVTIGDINFDETGVSGSGCGLEPLDCGTEYVFRWFAHAGRGFGRSDWGGNLTCSTSPCPPQRCTFTQGYWKTHGPEGCVTGNNTNEWPASALPMTLGTSGHLYTADELCSIFNTPAAGNCLISLAHQLIAAKLNLANGATDCAALDAAIASATTAISTKVVPPVGTGSISGSGCGGLDSAIDDLTAYNEGALCSPNCHSGAQRFGAQPAEKSPWGAVKIRYR
jgi:hypothetical protein